uniref:Uncharacterized protein n=1 Tax=Anopheles maculatus TaxID=74869 RepID=A0A182S8D1_9DIPT
MVKSQLPDGFATIRTRGLTRSKSRAEQYAPPSAQMSGRRSTMIGVVPPVMKPAGSGPLFECPPAGDNVLHQQGHQQPHQHKQEQLRYKSSSATAIATPPPVPPRTSSERTVSDRSSSVETPEDVDEECDGVLEMEDEKQLPTGGQQQQQQQQPPTGPYREDDDIYYTSSLTYETFKPLTKSANLEMKVGDSSNYLNLAQSSEYIESLAYDFSLPPLKSPQYINELNMMRTRALDVSGAGGKGGEQMVPMPLLFAAPPPYNNAIRPDSPPSYGKIRSSYRSTTPESLDNGSSNSSTYSHPLHHGSSNGSSGSRSVFLYDVPAKTIVAVAPHSLQYRKSFNHSNSRTDIIYEEPKTLHRNGGTCISSDTDSSYDGGSSGRYLKIHKNASAELLNFADISTCMLGSRPNGYIRRYATLGHPGKDLRYGQHGCAGSDGGVGGDEDEFGAGAKSTSSLNDQDLVKVDDDLLNYKIGCQTTLRSKPVIPWYELAIRKDHRQSCPAMKEVSRDDVLPKWPVNIKNGGV